MTSADPRDILTAVANGTLSPAEAATLLDRVRPADGSPAPDAEPAPVSATWQDEREEETQAQPTTATSDEEVEEVEGDEVEEARHVPTASPEANGAATRAVRVDLNGGGPVEIECRADVEAPQAEGPADITITQTDTAISVEGEVGSDSLVTLPSCIDLALQVNAGDCAIHGLDGTLEAELNCGNVELSARMVEGRSRIRANAGNIEVTLTPDSDLTLLIKTPATIDVDDSFTHSGRGVWTRGSGAAELTIAGHTGNVSVQVG